MNWNRMWQSSWICPWKLCHAWKLVWFHVETSFFLFISKCGTFIKSHRVFLCYFLEYHEVLLSNFLDGCCLSCSLLFLWIQSMVIKSQNYFWQSKFHKKVKSDMCLLFILLSNFSNFINLQPIIWCSVKTTKLIMLSKVFI